jgi:uncharacterized protein YecE (DUF72 family)
MSPAPESTPPFEPAHAADLLRRLAGRGIYIGTSSWKYPGWVGSLYTEGRYIYRGRLSKARFERECLSEYAGVFRSVCVDAAYYTFPSPKYLAGLVAQVPDGFRFSFKVTDDITLKHFPNLDRFGSRRGQANPHFLDAALFTEAFLTPCMPHRDKVGLLMFEFSHFHPVDYGRGRDFIGDLDRFLGQLPSGWDYGVEIRNRSFLHPEYFDVLRRHRVVHVYNSWEAMPPVEEQWLAPGSRTHPDCIGARFLLRPGRRYAEAVDQFSPYAEVQDPYPAGRRVMVEMILASLRQARPGRAYIYINNRFEGSALGTLAAVLQILENQLAQMHPRL